MCSQATAPDPALQPSTRRTHPSHRLHRNGICVPSDGRCHTWLGRDVYRLEQTMDGDASRQSEHQTYPPAHREEHALSHQCRGTGSECRNGWGAVRRYSFADPVVHELTADLDQAGVTNVPIAGIAAAGYGAVGSAQIAYVILPTRCPTSSQGVRVGPKK